LLRGQQEALIFAQAADRLLVEKFGFTATRRRQKKKRGGGRQCQHRTHWFEVSAAVGRASSLRRGGLEVAPQISARRRKARDVRASIPRGARDFPNYDPKPNASARIAVLGKLPAAQTFGHVVHHGPGGWTSGGNTSGAGRTSTRSGPRRRLWARDGSESPTNQREPTVKIATLIDHIENLIDSMPTEVWFNFVSEMGAAFRSASVT
jgi:hypothetical protein